MPDADDRMITLFLRGALEGEPERCERLASQVYRELRKLARGGSRRFEQTPQTTMLVNEAWLRIARKRDWQDRGHFYGVAAAALRSVLVDHLRARNAVKRGGRSERVELDAVPAEVQEGRVLLLDLDAALSELRDHDPDLAHIADLRLILQLSLEEIADQYGVSTRTISRRWRAARAWLERRLASVLD